jgi:hypothetical protein
MHVDEIGTETPQQHGQHIHVDDNGHLQKENQPPSQGAGPDQDMGQEQAAARASRARRASVATRRQGLLAQENGDEADEAYHNTGQQAASSASQHHQRHPLQQPFGRGQRAARARALSELNGGQLFQRKA